MQAKGLLIATLVTLAGATNASEPEGFKSFNDITGALNPLAIVANDGGIRRSIDLNIQFAINSATLLPAATQQIQALAQALNGARLAQCAIFLTGHTDFSGNADNNVRLSIARAKAVLNALARDYGVNPDMLDSDGVGANNLLSKLAPNDPKHRRVEIAVVNQVECRQSTQRSVKENSTDVKGKVKINW
ncbi:MAG: outer membrane protein OmpA-like peptidoglycan-associated protein [Paraglaciecola sp.]|jgi:outer membrane protein OmpA-like peptidoglycan-associated protein